MENIDITDAAFSLSILPVQSSTNWMSIIFGAILGILVISIALYNYTHGYKKHVTFKDDCPGGFCTMNQSPPTSSI